ncbi:MAG: AAA family ATPase [Candidatus Thiodiazotropha weberae]|nr:AAA family ATPase [Candidatus Thiodiazotropha lotti]MCG8012261.1 AAA family ATPase [Candidatus Thiodiazotropha lotti]MCW4211731.1 AAA family ATPase [Candidatus Thiodiazotropha lotti]MCW4216756.1 AAA family ATPase [Candidatus Thiodiazotropha lotti]
MKLKELRISNFRGLGGNNNVIRFDDSNVIFLIGQNNTGKSSFLNAYQFFVAPKKKSEKEDFFQYDTNHAIEIEGDFISEDDDSENADFNNEPDWIDKWVQDEAGIITIKKVWNEVGKEFEKFTKNKEGEFVKDGFGGLPTLFTKYSPEPIFINAIETIESLEKKVNDIIDKEHLKKIQNEYKEEYDSAIESITKIQEKITSSDSIGVYNDNINQSFGKVFPGLSLKISIKEETSGIDIVKAFKTNHSIDVKKDGVDRKETFDQHGHGVIRQALFNFLAFIKGKSESNKKEYLLLFEEPELFLHPKSTYLLREELYRLSEESPFQVLCATHSPQMIDISKPHSSLVRVIKKEDETTVTHQVGHNIFMDEVNKDFVQMINRFNPNVCETFYSNRVIVVEGDTEAVILRELLKINHEQSDFFILNSGSKNNIPFFQRILNHFKIPYVVIHDSDTRYKYVDKERTEIKLNKDGNPSKNSVWSLNQSIWDEIENGKAMGNDVKRMVSVYDFESQSGYVYDSEQGKPLSAYLFAKSMSNDEENYAVTTLSSIVNDQFHQEWSQDEIERIQEPVNGG